MPGAVVALVEIVIATVAVPLPGVTGFGVKLHVEFAGPPEQDKLTALVKVGPTGMTLKL